jgi:hypothetical protein
MIASATEASTYAEGVWWALHHSNDINRRACVLTCYVDESGTDSNSTVAVVGGLILTMKQFFWLDEEWRKCLDLHNIPWPLHMKEFGSHGKLQGVRSEARRDLFTDLAGIINDNKTMSVASTLGSEQYRRAFDGVTGLSMYGASFVQLAMINGTGARMGDYRDPIAYLLDTGNPYKHDAVDAHSFLVGDEDKYPLNMGTLAFDSDNKLSALQAADVVSWSVRRKLASELKSGFEPLAELFDSSHIEVAYEEEWMLGVAAALRGKMGT